MSLTLMRLNVQGGWTIP